MKYQITSYQLIYKNGDRDTVKPLTPIDTYSVDLERDRLKAKHGVEHVNMNYTAIPESGDEDEEE